MQIIALDTTTPQLRAPPSGSTYSAPRAIAMTPEALTGSAATSSLSIAQTWNTTGTPTAFDLNVTDTASNAASLLMNLRVGGATRFNVDKSGQVTLARLMPTGPYVETMPFAHFQGIFAGATSAFLGAANGAAWVVAGALAFTPANSAIGAVDLKLERDAADTLAQRRGTNPQAFNVYNTFTDASNYERGSMRWSSNLLQVGTQAAGTGTNRSVQVIAGAASYFFNANEVAIFPTAGGVEFSVRARISSPALGIIRLTEHNNANAGALELPEWATAPAAPAANNVRIYAEDNGAGKTRLMALFATGAAQQIAIEP